MLFNIINRLFISWVHSQAWLQNFEPVINIESHLFTFGPIFTLRLIPGLKDVIHPILKIELSKLRCLLWQAASFYGIGTDDSSKYGGKQGEFHCVFFIIINLIILQTPKSFFALKFAYLLIRSEFSDINFSGKIIKFL